MCQGSAVSEDNTQIAHAENEINPTILEPDGLNSRTAFGHLQCYQNDDK